MPFPLKYEIYEISETRGDGRSSAVREVRCFYRVSDGRLLWMLDPALDDLTRDDAHCGAVKQRGRWIGFMCNRSKGHQGDHASLDQGGGESSLGHVWPDSDCTPEQRAGDEPV